MTKLVRRTVLALGLLVLGALALPPIGCGENSNDSLGTGGSQWFGMGGAVGGSGGAGTGSGVQTGFACSGGGGESGNASTTKVPRTCYSYVTGTFYCNPGVCGCYYNPVTGCECADGTVSPCKPLDPKCTAAVAGGPLNGGPADPSRNVSCYCDSIGYWQCN
jgi:hypothetical protein